MKKPPFNVSSVGEGRERILILTAADDHDWQPLGGVRGIIEAACLPQFDEELARLSHEEAIAWLGVTSSVAFRLRQARGLTETYQGDSPTTLWRRENHADQ